jgi:hypothetical protein
LGEPGFQPGSPQVRTGDSGPRQEPRSAAPRANTRQMAGNDVTQPETSFFPPADNLDFDMVLPDDLDSVSNILQATFGDESDSEDDDFPMPSMQDDSESDSSEDEDPSDDEPPPDRERRVKRPRAEARPKRRKITHVISEELLILYRARAPLVYASLRLRATDSPRMVWGNRNPKKSMMKLYTTMTGIMRYVFTSLPNNPVSSFILSETMRVSRV